MSTGGRQLLDHGDELLAALKRRRLPTWAVDVVRELVVRELRSLTALAASNADRQAQVHAGIHCAADRFLPAFIARGASRSAWAGALRKYLVGRYVAFGLERLPCQRVVREALKKWTPPLGGICESGYGAADNTEEAHGEDRIEAGAAGQGQRRG